MFAMRNTGRPKPRCIAQKALPRIGITSCETANPQSPREVRWVSDALCESCRLEVGKKILAEHPRADMPGFQPNAEDQRRIDYHALRQRVEARNLKAASQGKRVYDERP